VRKYLEKVDIKKTIQESLEDMEVTMKISFKKKDKKN